MIGREQLIIEVLWQPQATRYRLQSAGVTRQDAQDGAIVYAFATVDESPSDYVADRVEAALGQGTPTPLYAWFDHTAPVIPPVAPLTPQARAARASFLRGLSFPGGERLDEEQVAAALA